MPVIDTDLFKQGELTSQIGVCKRAERTVSADLFMLSLRILHAPKADRAGTIIARCHQQQLAVLRVPVRLGEVPHGAQGVIVAAATHDRSASMVVGIFVGPLPHVAHHVHHAKWARSVGMRIDIAGWSHLAAMVRDGRRCILWVGPEMTEQGRRG